MSAKHTPTPAQRIVLRSLADGRAPTAHLRSIEEVKDCEALTLPALRAAGWTDAGGFITNVGLAAIAKATGEAL